MAVSSTDRVKKHRVNVNGTAEGREKMRCKAREYKARSRRKMNIKHLSEENTEMKNVLPAAQQTLVNGPSPSTRDDIISLS